MSTSGWEVDDGGETGVFIGMTVPLLVLTGIGAWVSTDAALSDPMGRISSLLGGGLPAVVALIALGTSLAVGNAFNDFSGGRDCPRLVNHLLSARLSGFSSHKIRGGGGTGWDHHARDGVYYWGEAEEPATHGARLST